MFNFKELFKLQIRPSSVLLLITYHRIGECFTATELRSEKFDDDDDDDDDDNNNNNNNK